MTTQHQGVYNCIIFGGPKPSTGPMFRPTPDGVYANLDSYFIRPIVPADRRCHRIGLGGLGWWLLAGFQAWRAHQASHRFHPIPSITKPKEDTP